MKKNCAVLIVSISLLSVINLAKATDYYCSDVNSPRSNKNLLPAYFTEISPTHIISNLLPENEKLVRKEENLWIYVNKHKSKMTFSYGPYDKEIIPLMKMAVVSIYANENDQTPKVIYECEEPYIIYK